jgi:hypothetical protein
MLIESGGGNREAEVVAVGDVMKMSGLSLSRRSLGNAGTSKQTRIYEFKDV